jgi:two-component system phosphate regulon response regulator PhoB
MARIAIIEDEPQIQQMYLMKLKSAGFDVAAAEDGQKGLKLIKDFKPDLVLLDLRMPVMDGTTMLKRLREQDWGRNVLVIVSTNLSPSEAPMDLRLLRVEKYILKVQYTPKQVVETVTETLRRYGKLS